MLTHALTVALLSMIALAVSYGRKNPSAGKLMAILFAACMLGLLSYAVLSTLM